MLCTNEVPASTQGCSHSQAWARTSSGSGLTVRTGHHVPVRASSHYGSRDEKPTKIDILLCFIVHHCTSSFLLVQQQNDGNNPNDDKNTQQIQFILQAKASYFGLLARTVPFRPPSPVKTKDHDERNEQKRRCRMDPLEAPLWTNDRFW